MSDWRPVGLHWRRRGGHTDLKLYDGEQQLPLMLTRHSDRHWYAHLDRQIHEFWNIDEVRAKELALEHWHEHMEIRNDRAKAA